MSGFVTENTESVEKGSSYQTLSEMDDERIVLVTNTLAASWLDLQCKMIPNAINGMAAFNLSDNQTIGLATCWPEKSRADAELSAAIDLAIIRRAVVTSSQPSTNENPESQNLVIAQPLFDGNDLIGVVAVSLQAKIEQQAAVMQLLQWGGTWLQMLVAQRDSPASSATSESTPSSTLFECISSALHAPNTEAALKSAVTVLASELACERVTLGLVEQNKVNLVALSNSAHFDSHSALIRSIEASMQEAITIGSTINYPPSSPKEQQSLNSDNPLDAHNDLSTNEDGEYVCTVVLKMNSKIIGAVCLERDATSPFDANTVALCEQIGHLLSPTIAMRKKETQSILHQLVEDYVIAPLRSIFGRHNPGKKAATASVFMLLLILGFGSGDYRVTAPASIEGIIQRVIIAPFDGYISQTHISAGESVTAGQLLAELDDRKLNLEQQQWHGKRDELKKHYRKALADLDHAEARIVQSRIAQAEAQLAVITQQLERTRLVAPFDGIIISGDLNHSLGTPVERGQILFEVAPLDHYRIALEVDGRDIPDIKMGQTGTLILSAMPGNDIAFSVEKIASITQETEGPPAFRVEGVINDDESIRSLRPGMQGIGKVMIGSRNYSWVWTRRMIGWLQLHLWSWLP